MHFEFANVLVFTVVAVGFVFANLLLARLLRPRRRAERSKHEIYECGEPTIGQAWIRFDIRFYTIALMFVIFDVEVALLFPWGAIFRDLVGEGLGTVALIEAGAFIVILMVGLAYVWVRGDIDWTALGPVEENRRVDERRRVTVAEGPARPDSAAAADPRPGGGGDA